MSSDADYPSIDRIAELQQMIADFSEVLRAVPMMHTGRRENDVDHSFGLALTCWFLAPHIAPDLDIGKILRYALAHDIVELHAGDAFVFGDKETLASKSDREDSALEYIARDWPDFPELTAFAKGYKDHSDAEADFVYTIDKMLPAIMTKLGEDSDYWKRHKVTREMHETEKGNKMQRSPEARQYLDMLNAWMVRPDDFYKPDQTA